MTSGLGAIVLAAGAGRRFTMAKALATDSQGVPWVETVVNDCLRIDCDPVVVVLGADAERARPLVPPAAQVVVASQWERGMSESLRAGLDALEESAARAALVRLVDQPDMPPQVVDALLQKPIDTATLRRVTVHGKPSHPVILGRDHWQAIGADLEGDSGARSYLARHGVEPVEVADLWDGADHDFRD